MSTASSGFGCYVFNTTKIEGLHIPHMDLLEVFKSLRDILCMKGGQMSAGEPAPTPQDLIKGMLLIMNRQVPFYYSNNLVIFNRKKKCHKSDPHLSFTIFLFNALFLLDRRSHLHFQEATLKPLSIHQFGYTLSLGLYFG